MNELSWTASPFVIITLASLASYASRGLGTALSGRIRADSPVVEWVTAITYALMAGLITRMIVLPVGSLDATADWMRLAATLVGVVVFYLTRRNVAVGVFTGSGALLVFTLL